MVNLTDGASSVVGAHAPESRGRAETLLMRMRRRPVFRSVREDRPQRFLDLGCGFRAELLTALSRDVPTLVGVDHAVDPVHASHYGIVGISGPIIETLSGLESESFDGVAMLSVFEWLPDPQEALDGIHRVLAPGGVAFVHVPRRAGGRMGPMAARAGFRAEHTRMRPGLGGLVLDAELRKAPAA
jgi:SAM-dependent methyltransferase